MIAGKQGEAMAETVFHPDFKAMPFWWEAWQPRREETEAAPARTHVAIIGGGYAGLNTALELKRNGVDATVFEAEDFGFGASTRNGGQVSGGVNLRKAVKGPAMPKEAS